MARNYSKTSLAHRSPTSTDTVVCDDVASWDSATLSSLWIVAYCLMPRAVEFIEPSMEAQAAPALVQKSILEISRVSWQSRNWDQPAFTFSFCLSWLRCCSSKTLYKSVLRPPSSFWKDHTSKCNMQLSSCLCAWMIKNTTHKTKPIATNLLGIYTRYNIFVYVM